MVSHTALLVIKQFTSQKIKCCNGPMLMKFTGLTVLSIILKQLVLQKGNVTFSLQLQGQQGGNNLQVFGNVLQKLYML